MGIKNITTKRKPSGKKSLFKKWWFWLIAVVIIVGAFGESEETPTIQDSSREPIVSDVIEPSTTPEEIQPPTSSEDSTPPYEEPPAEESPAVDNLIINDSSFNIHFIDVGQADAALVECDGHYMLIDGGNKGDSSLIYSVLKKASVPKLDIVVGTHAHEDHIGGLPGAFNYTTADLTLSPVKSYDSDAFRDFAKYADQNGNGITVPKKGDTYPLGSSTITILGLNGGSDTNDTSIILRIDYGQTSFLFTGDAEREAEEAILNSIKPNLEATVLKVGHHGSETSTSYRFLNSVMPRYAIISVGTGNSYGHPTGEVLSRLRDADVKVFRTDLQGDIFCTSDGHFVSFSVSRNEDADVFGNIGNNSTQQPETESPSAVVTPAPLPEPTPEPSAEPQPEPEPIPGSSSEKYIGNINSDIFHRESCTTLPKEKNRVYFDSRQQAIDAEYRPCKNCNP